MLVVQTPRIAIIRMSTSGSRERSSSRTQAAITTLPRASRPSVFGEPQPQVLVSVIASRTPEMPSGHQRRGAVVDLGRRLDRRLGDVAPGQEGGERR